MPVPGAGPHEGRRMARRRSWRLLAAEVVAAGVLGTATLAHAQARPTHDIGGKQVEEPDMMKGAVRGADGALHPLPGYKVAVVGADGQPEKNPDGSPKMVDLSTYGGPPPERLSPEAAAKAQANGVTESEGVTTSGDVPWRGVLPAGSRP